jgi:hypothetical protein
MSTNLAIAFSVLMLGAASPALACSKTLEIIASFENTDTVPTFRCGAEFNEMLTHVSKKEWKAALAAYELHLTRVGKWQVGTPEAEDALKYLRAKAAAQ